jgi:hypothetical protein
MRLPSKTNYIYIQKIKYLTMRKIYLLISATLCIALSHSQNLVPNPSFEDPGTIDCGIYTSTNFNNSINLWTIAGGTPDLFSTEIDPTCYNFQPNSTYPGPIGLKGPQSPHSGRIFAGILGYTIAGMNSREYVQAPLDSPLIVGHDYCVEFYVSLADYHEKYIDKLGAYFTTTAISSAGTSFNTVPQVAAPGFISNSTNWVLISGSFTATDAANYITIGNFYDDTSTGTMINPGGTGDPGTYGAYYFIDDVSVLDCTGLGIKEDDINTTIHIFPNPFTNSLTFDIKNEGEFLVSIRNISGEAIYAKNITKQNNTIDVSFLPKGFYVATITGNGIIGSQKIVKF